MRRITHSTAVAVKPDYASTGVTGYFTPGSVPDNVPPTTLTADWCNAVQEEIALPIEAAGLALNGADNAQLLQAIGILSARKNVLMNAGGTVGWRNAIVAGATGTGYATSRWYTKSTGSTYSAELKYFDAAVAGDPPHNPAGYLSVAVTSVAGASNHCRMGQCIEGVRTLQGGKASLSLWVRRSAAGDFAVSLRQHFGTGGNPSADVVGIGAHKFTAPDTAWHYYTLENITVPSITGKTVGTNDNDYLDLQIWADAGSSFNAQTDTLGQESCTLDLYGACLVSGPVALPYCPLDFHNERSACSRYYETSRAAVVSQGIGAAEAPYTVQVCGASTATRWYGTTQFLAVKRVAPTITFFNPVNANAQAYNSTLAADCSATAAADINRIGFGIVYTTAPGSAAGDAVCVSWCADSEFYP